MAAGLYLRQHLSSIRGVDPELAARRGLGTPDCQRSGKSATSLNRLRPIIGNRQRSRCHVLGLSITPDLRKLSPDRQGQFKDIVLKGAAAPLGMESFNDILSEADVEAIQAYVIDQAWQGYNEQEKSKAK